MSFNVPKSRWLVLLGTCLALWWGSFSILAQGYTTAGNTPSLAPIANFLGKGGSNTLYVTTGGNDATALIGRMDLPWASVNTALSNAVSGNVVVIGSGAFTNLVSNMPVPAGVSLFGSGRGNTFLYFTNTSGFVATAGWIELSNNTTVVNLTIGGVPDGTWHQYVPVVIEANATNILFQNVEINGQSDVGVWDNSSQATFVDCRFETRWDGWTDVGTAGKGWLRFFNCEGYAHTSADTQSQTAGMIDILNFTSGSSTNVVWAGGGVLISNVVAGQTGAAFSSSVYLYGCPVLFQQTNAASTTYVSIPGAVIGGHPYPEYLTPGATYIGDVTNAVPGSGAFMMVYNSGDRRWSYGWPTNAPSGGVINAGNAYCTNLAANWTITGIGNVPNNTGWSAWLVCSNSSAGARTITLPNGFDGSYTTGVSLGHPCLITVTQNLSCLIELRGYGQVFSNATVYPRF